MIFVAFVKREEHPTNCWFAGDVQCVLSLREFGMATVAFFDLILMCECVLYVPCTSRVSLNLRNMWTGLPRIMSKRVDGCGVGLSNLLFTLGFACGTHAQVTEVFQTTSATFQTVSRCHLEASFSTL